MQLKTSTNDPIWRQLRIKEISCFYRPTEKQLISFFVFFWLEETYGAEAYLYNNIDP